MYIAKVGKEVSYTGKKWILVMDDEEIIRTVVRAVLEQAGFNVYLTENGDEAVGCYQEARRCGYPFDAVIVDLNVPQGRGGREMMRTLLEIDPSVHAIVTSGALDDPIIADFRSYGFKGVLKKPFSSVELETTVRSVISI